MENNKIIKILSSPEGIVILRENGLEKITTNEDIEKDELIASLKDELQDDYGEIPDTKLEDMGILKEVAGDVITRLRILNEDGKFKLTIRYLSGKVENIDGFFDDDDLNDRVDSYLDKLENSYDLELEDLIATGVIRDRSNFLGVGHKKIEDNFKEKLSSLKIKNLNIRKKGIIALGVATVLVLTGMKINFRLKKQSNSNNNTNNEYTVTLPPTEEPVVTPEVSTYVAEEIPTAPVIPSEPVYVPPVEEPLPTEPAISQVEMALIPATYPVRYNPDETPELVVEIYNDHYDTYNVLDQKYVNTTIDDFILNNTYANFADLSNCIFDHEYNPNLVTTGTVVHFEQFFMDSNDKAYVKHFADLLNEIIYLGYDEGKIAEVVDCNKSTCKELVAYIKYNLPLKTTLFGEEKIIRFSDLTPYAQEKLKLITRSFNFLLGPLKIDFNGEIYDQARLDEEIFGYGYEPSPVK